MLTQARLKEVLKYNRKTGVFTWRVTLSPRAMKGAEAGCIRVSDGYQYLVVRVDSVLYRANRLAWLYVRGEWPEHQVDHKNRSTLDNAWCNLRHATNKQNGENSSLRKDNTSGFRGVNFNPKLGKWIAKIKHHRQQIHLGCFTEKSDAVQARFAAEKKLFTHSENCR